MTYHCAIFGADKRKTSRHGTKKSWPHCPVPTRVEQLPGGLRARCFLSGMSPLYPCNILVLFSGSIYGILGCYGRACGCVWQEVRSLCLTVLLALHMSYQPPWRHSYTPGCSTIRGLVAFNDSAWSFGVPSRTLSVVLMTLRGRRVILYRTIW